MTGVVRTARAAPSERACFNCQKRKTRCIGPSDDSSEPCYYCTKNGKTCVYSERPSRTPLTRKNLDDAEARCRALEAALENQRAGSQGNEYSDERSQQDGTPRPPRRRRTTEASVDAGSPDDTVRRRERDSATYEWNESSGVGQDESAAKADKAPDGMASLGDEGAEVGYLGESIVCLLF